MLAYAALFWWKRTYLTTIEKQFAHIQRITCLDMSGCMSTTPNFVIEKEPRQALHCSVHFKKLD
jgi:hypothetical protein